MDKHVKTEWKWLVDDNAFNGLNGPSRVLIKNRIRKIFDRRVAHAMPGLGKHTTIEVSTIPPESAKSYLALQAKLSTVAEKALDILNDPTATYIQAVVISSRGISAKVVQFTGSGQTYRHAQDVQHDMRLTMPAEVRAVAHDIALQHLAGIGVPAKEAFQGGLSLLDTRKPVEHISMDHTIDNTTVTVVYQGQLVARIELSWKVLDSGEVTCITRLSPVNSSLNDSPYIHEY